MFRVWIKIHVSAEQCHEETDRSYITNCFAKVLLWDFFCCFITSLTAGDMFQTILGELPCLCSLNAYFKSNLFQVYFRVDEVSKFFGYIYLPFECYFLFQFFSCYLWHRHWESISQGIPRI